MLAVLRGSNSSAAMAMERDVEADDDEETMLKIPEDGEEDEESESNGKDGPPFQHPWSRKMVVEEVAMRLKAGDLAARINAARDVRTLVRKSSNNSKSAVRRRLAAAGVIEPLVSMLHGSFPTAAREVALLALLNLAARNQKNKIRIVTAGAVPSLVELLKHQPGNLCELAAAAILSLSSAPSNKPTIAASGAVLLLIQVLCSASIQGRVDAVTALYYLSTSEEDEPKPVLDTKAVLPLFELLKECKKYSKLAEKTTYLLEIFSHSEEGRAAITRVEGGILGLVETVEDGSSVSMSHAVGALLSLCQSSRDKYQDLILKEGAIPGLLRLTCEGTATARDRARTLLDLLRDPPPERRLTPYELERIVYDFAAQVDGTDKAAETAKKLLQDMVKKSLSLSNMNL
ncbi:U-box domain-containing protein 10 [Andrographis paniculata]|uniref:U-box domain-containing protein 10 n=1 Tax=Andrographis paniculata TaxID=175694 RepID=UPI0021E6E7CE|nr:U-box domain-containing protein 10 [Andrographis paniculata]